MIAVDFQKSFLAGKQVGSDGRSLKEA